MCQDPEITHLSAYEMYYALANLGIPDDDVDFDGMDLVMCRDTSRFRLMNGAERVASTDEIETQIVLGWIGRVRA